MQFFCSILQKNLQFHYIDVIIIQFFNFTGVFGMYKYTVCLFAFLFSLLASAADLTLADGTVYANAELKKCAGGFIYLQHEKGEAKIALENIPENFIAALSSRQRNALRNGADIKLADGMVYKNCTVQSMGKTLLTIKHAQGTLEISFSELPEYYRATFTSSQLAKIYGQAPSAAGSAAQTQILGKTANGQLVYSGPRGGRYYVNERGRKVYLKKDIEVKPIDGVKSTAGQP